MRKNNLFVLPEGSGDTGFISNYYYSGVQNYNMSSWGGGAYSLGIDSARKKRATTIDDNIKPYRDTAVALGGVSIAGMNFEDNYLDASMKERELEAALVTSTGHLAFLHLGSSARIGQAANTNALFRALQGLHPRVSSADLPTRQARGLSHTPRTGRRMRPLPHI